MLATEFGDPLFGNFAHIRTSFDPDGVFWIRMAAAPTPCFSHTLLRESRSVQRSIQASQGTIDWNGQPSRIKYIVLASAVPGVFNVGGDIALFRRLIENRDRDGLFRYALACIDGLYQHHVSCGIPAVSVSLVQGSALGGGMEVALSSSVVIAERGVEMGLPEVLFNLFPGMGAYNLIARRTNPRMAEQLMTSGIIYKAEALYELGLVDILAEPGEGEVALRQFVRGANRKFKTLQAVARVREAMHPVRFDDLLRIAQIWVDAALELDERDLKTMERLSKAQARSFAQRATSEQADDAGRSVAAPKLALVA